MKAVWIDEGQGPDFPRLERHGIRRLYFSARPDQGHSKADVDKARARGYEVGIYRVSSWDLANNAALTGAQWADMLNRDCSRFLGGDGRGVGVQLAVQMDVEEHDPRWIAECLHRWRRVRNARDTSWTMEAFQGGWMVEIRDEVLAANVRLVPQAYGGPVPEDPRDMRPFDPFGCVKDLTDHGFPLDRIQVFYDAARLYRGWFGYGFTQQRLPA